MNDEILDALLAGFPLPSLAIDRTERIIAANTEALTLINQQARGQNYVTYAASACACSTQSRRR